MIQIVLIKENRKWGGVLKMKYTFIFMTPGNSFPGYLSETFKYVLDKILKLLFLLPNTEPRNIVYLFTSAKL